MIDFFKVKPTVEEDLARIAEIVKGAENRILFLVDDGEYCIVDQLGKDVDTISMHAGLNEYFPEDDVFNAACEFDCPFVIFEGSYHISVDYYGDIDDKFDGAYRAPTDREMEIINLCYTNYERPRLWPSANLLADLHILHWHNEQRMEHYANLLRATEPLMAWLAFVEAGAELDGDQLTNDTIALSFCAHGASTTVTIGDMRKLGAAIKGAVAHK